MATPTLPLDPAPRTNVFRAIDRMLRADATLRRVCPPDRPGKFRSWSGDPADKNVFGADQAPGIRITPCALGPDVWYSPDAQEADLGVRVELLVKGTNADDLMNLWWAVQKAVSGQANANTLVAAGSFSGVVSFQAPAFPADDAAANGWYLAVGVLKVDVIEELNP
jgi:hypothetical protein